MPKSSAKTESYSEKRAKCRRRIVSLTEKTVISLLKSINKRQEEAIQPKDIKELASAINTLCDKPMKLESENSSLQAYDPHDMSGWEY